MELLQRTQKEKLKIARSQGLFEGSWLGQIVAVKWYENKGSLKKSVFFVNFFQIEETLYGTEPEPCMGPREAERASYRGRDVPEIARREILRGTLPTLFN